MRSLFSTGQFSDDDISSRGVAIYMLAVATVMVAAIAQHLFVGVEAPFLMFFPAILISAWLGGWRAGLVASFLSVALAGYYFLEPLYHLFPTRGSQLWREFIFLSEGLFISALGEARLQSRRALIEQRDLLEERVAQRTQEMATANEQLAAQISEREKAQLAQAESELKFRSVIETASDAIVMSDVKGNVVSWNRGAQEMFGYAPEEILQQPVALIVPHEFRAAHIQALQNLQEGAAPRLMGIPLELRGRHCDGREFPIELSLASWQLGAAQFYSGIIRDLTQRKQAEDDRLSLVEEVAKRAELEAAEQHYRLLAEAIPQIVWTALPNGTTDYFNQHWFDYTGLKAGQSLDWHWQQALHPDDQERALKVWQKATATGDDYEIEYRFKRHDGAYRWHLGRGVPLHDEAGHIFKWFGTCTDIDVQKRAEETSRFQVQAMQRLTASLDEAAIAQTLTDLCAILPGTQCVIDVIETSEIAPDASVLNTASFQLLRVARAGQNDESVNKKVTPQSQASQNQTLRFQAPESSAALGPWRALLSAQTQVLRGAEIEPLTRQGEILEIWQGASVPSSPSVLCVPLSARGHTLGVLTVMRFATAHQEMPSSVIEDLARNAALMIDSARLLRQTQEANRAKDEFLAVLSHELRTPLTAILGWVQLLQSGALDSETQQRALATINRNTHAQVQLIEDLLDLSRIITGKLRLELQPVNLGLIVEAALETVRPTAQAKEVALFVSLAPEPKLVLGDAHRLQQVLWNLLSNAVKFTPKGGRIEVSMRQVSSSVEITVRDSGGGISAEFLPYVFDRFRQADSSSTRQHGGLGLGLSIVRHVTELHGGTVQVASEGIDQGATFTITLPLAPLNAPPLNAAPQNIIATSSETAETSSEIASVENFLSGVRVLLVDDERDAREMLGAVLRNYGAQVKICQSAREALDALPDWQPRVLVSDIGMPGEDGYDLISQVRALPPAQGGAVPAMALTAYARATDREMALRAGFNTHVIKPVDPKNFATLVAGLANNS